MINKEVIPVNDKNIPHLTDREKKIYWNGILMSIIIGILMITLLLAFLNKLI